MCSTVITWSFTIVLRSSVVSSAALLSAAQLCCQQRSSVISSAALLSAAHLIYIVKLLVSHTLQFEHDKPGYIWQVDKLSLCSPTHGWTTTMQWKTCQDRLRFIAVIVTIFHTAGVKLQVLTYDQLPCGSGQISIRGDELAIPGWDDKKLHLFKLNYM